MLAPVLGFALTAAGHLGATIAFCTWFYYAYGNLRALGVNPRHTQGLAPGCFFIPIANLWLAYAIAAEIWRGSAQKDRSR